MAHPNGTSKCIISWFQKLVTLEHCRFMSQSLFDVVTVGKDTSSNPIRIDQNSDNRQGNAKSQYKQMNRKGPNMHPCLIPT